MRLLYWYHLRWRIEDWHRILKIGCRVEYLGHQTGDSIERAVTIKAVIAGLLAAIMLLGRETPNLPIEILFSYMEIMVLEYYATHENCPVPVDLGTAVLVMAMLGGYLYQERDGPPGYRKI